MKILLLGGKGNLAGAFLKAAADRDDLELIAWDKEEVDITDRGLLEKKVADLKPAAIINTVAYNDVDRCETDDEARVRAQKLNIDSVRHLAEICLEQRILLVHYSSDYVFSGQDAGGYDEAAEPAPLNEYGETKAKGERELIKLSGRGLKWYLIRTARLFGQAGSGPDAKPSFFDIIRKLAAAQPELKLVADERGSFTYTTDLAEATLSLIDSGDGYGIYHLINSGSASWEEAGSYFLKQAGIAASVRPVSGDVFARPARRPKQSLLLNTKRPALRSWQEAVDDYIKGA